MSYKYGLNYAQAGKWHKLKILRKDALKQIEEVIRPRSSGVEQQAVNLHVSGSKPFGA